MCVDDDEMMTCCTPLATTVGAAFECLRWMIWERKVMSARLIWHFYLEEEYLMDLIARFRIF